MCDKSVDSSCPRGGAHRSAVPKYDSKSLYNAWVAFAKRMGEKTFDFGQYNTIMRSRAVSAQGLLANIDFLEMFVTEVRSAEVHYSDIKDVARRLMDVMPHLKHSGSSSRVCERAMTMLAHVRRLRLKDQKKREQATRMLDDVSKARIENLISLITDRGRMQPAKLPAPTSAMPKASNSPLKRGSSSTMVAEPIVTERIDDATVSFTSPSKRSCLTSMWDPPSTVSPCKSSPVPDEAPDRDLAMALAMQAVPSRPCDRKRAVFEKQEAAKEAERNAKKGASGKVCRGKGVLGTKTKPAKGLVMKVGNLKGGGGTKTKPAPKAPRTYGRMQPAKLPAPTSAMPKASNSPLKRGSSSTMVAEPIVTERIDDATVSFTSPSKRSCLTSMWDPPSTVSPCKSSPVPDEAPDRDLAMALAMQAVPSRPCDRKRAVFEKQEAAKEAERNAKKGASGKVCRGKGVLGTKTKPAKGLVMKVGNLKGGGGTKTKPAPKAPRTYVRMPDAKRSGVSKVLGRLRATYATKCSFIQRMIENTQKWRIVVQVEARNTPWHGAIIDALMEEAIHNSWSSEELVAMRNQIFDRSGIPCRRSRCSAIRDGM